MYAKQRLGTTLFILCSVGLTFGAANADASTATAPLMPTKDLVAHQSPMQSYLLPSELPSAAYNSDAMVPLMPTKDRLAHQSSPMQSFPWSQQYPVPPSMAHRLTGIEAPLMPTKDPLAHRGDMERDLLSWS